MHIASLQNIRCMVQCKKDTFVLLYRIKLMEYVMEKLKPKELKVLNYIKSFKMECGYAPSVRDICRDLNYKSTESVVIAEGKLRVFPIAVIFEGLRLIVQSVPYILKLVTKKS